jgi:HD-like signal output (HDOD) protein
MKSVPEDYTSIVNSLKGQLPSLPLVMDELMTIISDPNAALYAIKDIIKMDPSIYSQILKVVNTVRYRGDGEPRIINLNDAMQRLGLEQVKRIALNTSVLTLFSGIQFPNKFSPESLWIHSVGVAVTSASLADFLRFPMPDQAYSCGLIHDIGKLAKLKFDQKNFGEELNKAQEFGWSNHQMEINQEKIRHDLLGGEITKEWGISPLVEAVTKWHHEEERSKRIDVENSDIHTLIDIVQFSNSLINEMKFGNSGHFQKTEPSALLMRRLKISDSGLDEFEEKLKIELEGEKEHLALFTKN